MNLELAGQGAIGLAKLIRDRDNYLHAFKSVSDTIDKIKPYEGIARQGLSGVKKIGKVLKKTRQSKHSFSKERYGHPSGTGKSKRHEGRNEVDNTFKTNTLYHFDCLTNIPRDKDNSTHHRRENDAIYFAGFKICMHIENISTTTPVWFNFAILQKKDRCDVSAAMSEDFFREEGVDRRARDFDQSGNEPNGIELHCLPVNPDKFLILQHKRYKLGLKNSNDTHGYYHTIDKYFKLQRQIRYLDTGGTVQQPLQIVFWCSTPYMLGGASPANAIKYSLRTITYFADRKY